MEIFTVFNDGLLKSTMATVVDGITPTGNSPPYVLDRLFESFGDESLSDVDDRNDDVGELSDQAGGETDTDTVGAFSITTRTSVMRKVTV